MKNRIQVCESYQAIILILAAITVAGSIVYFIKKRQSETPPNKWRKVGEISSPMWIFPVKSCGPIIVNEFECGLLGPENEYLRDRSFMLIKKDEFVSARTYPKMVLVTPRIVKSVLYLNAPGMDEISVDIQKVTDENKKANVRLWKDRADVIDCGNEAAAWFSKYLLDVNEAFRLVYYPSTEPKPVIEPKGYRFKTAERKDTGMLHDETSYMLMNLSSFDDLNTKLEKPVGPLQFRPNFVVKGATAWEEDSWKWLKIGEVIFQNVQPCVRCMFTTIDPQTGERDKNEQPLKTLKKFRAFEKISSSPSFGIHLGMRVPGIVKAGDSVYVGY
jgi:uncharacterized protein YcbX